MISGLPRPATTGSASCAPASASLRISGSGLISLLSGEKPDTIAPGLIATGNGARGDRLGRGLRARRAGSASRARERRSAQFGFELLDGDSGHRPIRYHASGRKRSAEPRWPSEL